MHLQQDKCCMEVHYYPFRHVQASICLLNLMHNFDWPVHHNLIYLKSLSLKDRYIFHPSHLHNSCYHDYPILKYRLYKNQDNGTWLPQLQILRRNVPRFLLYSNPCKDVLQPIDLSQQSGLPVYYQPYYHNRHHEKILNDQGCKCHQ